MPLLTRISIITFSKPTIKPTDFSFSFSKWPWASGFLDLKISWARNGENGSDMKRLTLNITYIKGFSPTTKTDEDTALFVRAVISLYAFMKQNDKYILSLIV